MKIVENISIDFYINIRYNKTMVEYNSNNLNNTLKSLRDNKGITQVAIANYLGIGKDLYNKYEKTNIRPPYETLIKLSDFYNVTTDYLLGIEEMNYINSGNNNVITGNGININSSFKNSNNANTNLSDEEQQIINDFRKLSKDKQAAIKLLLK